MRRSSEAKDTALKQRVTLATEFVTMAPPVRAAVHGRLAESNIPDTETVRGADEGR